MLIKKQDSQKRFNKGFTLLELSIVIVIIGLIVAGISAGQSLVKQAGIRNTISEVNKYRIAYNAFQLQYNAIPGDMINAASYWSTTSGDGNKLIGDWQCATTENLRFWHHLSLAGLIEGEYSGTGSDITRGVNTPANNYSSTAIFSVYGGTLWGKYPSKNSLLLSATPASGIPYCVGSYHILATDAYAIDKKTDDSLPGLGKVLSYGTAGGSCTSVQVGEPAYNQLTATYLIGTSTPCVMHFAFDDYVFK